MSRSEDATSPVRSRCVGSKTAPATGSVRCSRRPGSCGLVSVEFVARVRGDESAGPRPGSCTSSKQPLPRCPSGRVALQGLGHGLSRGAVRGAQVLPEQAGASVFRSLRAVGQDGGRAGSRSMWRRGPPAAWASWVWGGRPRRLRPQPSRRAPSVMPAEVHCLGRVRL